MWYINLKKINPFSFVLPLSEVEVRMRLKELSRSATEGCLFKGKVEQNSFFFIKNWKVFSVLKGVSKPGISGEFFEQNGKTAVNISLSINVYEVMVYAVFLVAFAIVGFVAGINQGVFEALVFSVALGGVFLFIIALTFVVEYLSFRSSVLKIRKTLCE